VGRKYRKVDPRFWWDEKVVGLSTAEKCIALYVLTAPTSNRIGMYRISVSGAADDLGMSAETFRERFANVCQTLGWGFDKVVSVVLMPKWWEYNPPENPNVLRGNLADLEDLPETSLFAEFLRHLRPLTETFGVTLPKRLANVTETFGESGTGTGTGTGTGKDVSLAVRDEPHKPTPHPSGIVFPVNGDKENREWPLTVEIVDLLQSSFPGLDIIAECRKALGWVSTNTPKTAKGMPKFLNGWMSRAVNNNRSGPQQPRRYETQQERVLREVREAKEYHAANSKQQAIDFGPNASQPHDNDSA